MTFRGDNIMSLGCLTIWQTTVYHKVDYIMKKENNVYIQKQHFKALARKLKFGCKKYI